MVSALNTIRNKFSKPSIICFYMALIIETFVMLYDKSANAIPYEGWIFRITFLLCVVKVILTKYDLKELLIIAFFTGLGLVSYRMTGRNEVLRYSFFIFACKGVDIKKAMKLLFYMIAAGVALLMLLSIFGINGSIFMTAVFRADITESRLTLGLGHPNALQCMIWSLTVLGMYVYYEKIKWLHVLILFVINTVFFVFTDSRTAFIATVLWFVLFAFVKYCETRSTNDKLLRGFGIANIAGYLFCIAFSIYAAGEAILMYLWWTEGGVNETRLKIIQFFDRILTGRIYWMGMMDDHDGCLQTWKLFSDRISTFQFDMGWIRLFFWYGIIPGAIVVIALLLIMIRLLRKRRYLEIIVLSTCAMYTVFEAHMVSDYMMRWFPILMVGEWWYLKNDSKQ